jgi:tagatose-1,6-bisphosphate aldolase
MQEKASPTRFAKTKPGLVIETARQITALPIDVLKAEFPADIESEPDEGRLLELCRELDRASRLPWVLLSAGVGFELFRKQVEIACKAGASGFLAGRALWQEGVGIRSRAERIGLLPAHCRSQVADTGCDRWPVRQALVCQAGRRRRQVCPRG